MTLTQIGSIYDSFDNDLDSANHVGIYRNGNNWYVLGITFADSATINRKISIFKSVDFGASWNKIGSLLTEYSGVFFPAPGGGPGGIIADNSLVTGQLGTKIYIIGGHNDNEKDGAGIALQPLRCKFLYSTFNMATDVATNQEGESSFTVYKETDNFTDLIDRRSAIALTRTQDIVLFHAHIAEPISGTNWTRVYYTTFNGTTFTGPTLLFGSSNARHYYCSGVVQDSTGNIHLFLVSEIEETFEALSLTNNGYNCNIDHLILNSSLQLLNSTTIISNIKDLRTTFYVNYMSFPILFTENGIEKVGFSYVNKVDDNFFNAAVYVASSPVSSPSWTIDTVVDEFTSDFYQGGTPTPRAHAFIYYGATSKILIRASRDTVPYEQYVYLLDLQEVDDTPRVIFAADFTSPRELHYYKKENGVWNQKTDIWSGVTIARFTGVITVDTISSASTTPPPTGSNNCVDEISLSALCADFKTVDDDSPTEHVCSGTVTVVDC